MGGSSIGQAIIIGLNKNAEQVAAAAAALSHSTRDALSTLEAFKDIDKARQLLGRVLSLGHESVIEHITFNIIFNNVSAVCEQFLIGFRLASFTVKSRRYQDFSHASFYSPFVDNQKEIFGDYVKSLFKIYADLLESDVPREDARFILPYCFCSNIFVTANARELIHIVKRMRSSWLKELNDLAESLERQLAEICPTVRNAIEKSSNIKEAYPLEIFRRVSSESDEIVDILSSPADAYGLLRAAADISGNPFDENHAFDKNHIWREAEQLVYTIRFNKLSLSALTHLTRHRMQSLVIPRLTDASFDQFVKPRKITELPELYQRYEDVFARGQEVADALGKSENRIYLALSGMTLRSMTTINLRELVLFLRLRTCRRAQWEIRSAALELLRKLRVLDPEIFTNIGPGCLMDSICPEGKSTCERPYHDADELMGDQST